jgi:hypothetical protein
VSQQQGHLDAAAASTRLSELREQQREAMGASARHKSSSAAAKAVQPFTSLLSRAVLLAEELLVALKTTETAAHWERQARERSEQRLLEEIERQAHRIHALEGEAAALRERVRQFSEAVMPAASEPQLIRVSGKLPYGYTRAPGGAVVEEPEQAAGVRLIFELHQSGQSLRKIAAYLTAQAIGTPRAEGERWQASSVRQILKQRDTYVGEQGYPALLGEQ